MDKSEEMAKASVEILEILKYAPLEVRLKIPSKYKRQIKINAEKSSHIWKYDTSKKLYEQDMLDTTKKILFLLYKEMFKEELI